MNYNAWNRSITGDSNIFINELYIKSTIVDHDCHFKIKCINVNIQRYKQKCVIGKGFDCSEAFIQCFKNFPL